jgi:uncharacterized protein (DUF488 family)
MPAIYTIGYGNRSIGDFIDLLRHYGVDLLADSRSAPTSRFQVNFRKKALQAHLEEAGISYLYLGDALGGKRVDPDCQVDGKIDLDCLWAKESFRAGLAQIAQAAQAGRGVALMCAELRPEQCHRAWMLAPPLEKEGFAVLHIDERGGLKTTGEVLGWFG